LSTSNVELQNMLIAYKKQLNEEVQEKAKKIQTL